MSCRANEPIKILAPHSFRAKLSRRALFQMGGAAAGLAIVAACGDDESPATQRRWHDSGTTAALRAGATGRRQRHRPGSTSDTATCRQQVVGSLEHVHVGRLQRPRHRRFAGREAPRRQDAGQLLHRATKTSSPSVEASKGTSGFDIVVPTGPYIPQMIQNGLLEKFDKTQAAQHGQRRPAVPRPRRGTPPTTTASARTGARRAGSTTRRRSRPRSRPGRTSSTCAKGEASGNCSVLDYAGQPRRHVLLGERHRLEHRGDRRSRRVREVPRRRVRHAHQGVRQLPQPTRSPRVRTPCRWRGTATPARPIRRSPTPAATSTTGCGVSARRTTELWMDNYCIAAGAPNPEAAHAWINWILIPEVSIKDLDYHGYNRGMKNMSQLLAELKPDLHVRRHDLLHGRAGRRRCRPR